MQEALSGELIESPATTTVNKVPLVVIAASAGGLNPISEILDYYPSDLPVATIVIQHLSPAYRSELVHLLQTHTSQAVHELHDDTTLAPNNIYVIQPGTQIVLDGNTVQALTREDSERPYFTIDVFLESLARRGDPVNACVVLLSGTGSDGTMGCRAVHDKGGYVLVQQLSDAKFDGMPLSVINSGAYDEVQPARLIPSRITAWQQNNMQRPAPPIDYLATDPLALLYADGETTTTTSDINPYAGIFELMRSTFDLDLNSYKIGTIDRRITQRMRRLGFTTIHQYQKLLNQGGNELRALFADLMIGVTSFFRNPQVFELLESKVLPDLVDRTDGPLKIWVCGCSTGEEAYSIAMLLQKLIAQKRSGNKEFRIYATDINPDAIRKASEATFEYGALQPFINRFGLQEFVSTNEDYGRLRVAPDVRRKIIFSVQNVLKHSPLHALDMVLCRNMLIYLRPEAQRKVISNFHFGLKEGAVLVLGESEGPAGLDPYFTEVDTRLKVFSKRIGVQLSSSDRWSLNRSVAPVSSTRQGPPIKDPMNISIARGAFEAAFINVAGDSLIIRNDGDVQYVTGLAGELFSRAMPGRPSLNLHTHMPDIELQALLQLGVSEALDAERSIEWEYHYISDSSPLKFDTLRFTRLSAPIEREPSVLIQMLLQSSSRSISTNTQGNDVLKTLQSVEGGLERLSKLERQNAQLRQMVKESVQDKETFHEELQSANEELLSSNEELQSTNEELQSVNEELHSVNAELEEKIRQLTEANNDISNLLSSTDVALIFLDDQLRIRRFTDVARNYFPLVHQDIGRPIDDLVSGLNHINITEVGQNTITTGIGSRHEAMSSDGKWLQVTFFPYRDHEGVPRGVVMSIYDITLMRHLLEEERTARLRRELLEQRLKINHWDISELSAEGVSGREKITLNESFLARLDYRENEPCETLSDFLALVIPEDVDAIQEAIFNALKSKTPFSIETRIMNKDGRAIWHLISGALHIRANGQREILGMTMEVDSRKREEISLQENQANARHANRIFNIGMLVSGVAHELNNPLSALQLGNEQLQYQIDHSTPDKKIIQKIASTQADAIIRMDHIISSLLRFSRKDSTADMKSIHIADLLQDVTRLTHPQANEAFVELSVEMQHPQMLLACHPLELAQALVNLTSNAIQQVAGKPGAWVRISVTNSDDHCIFKISDSGRTQDIKEPERLFTPFYTTKEIGHGTGLGLPLSQGIAEAHGGSLHLDRRMTHTTFVLKIPSHASVLN